MANAAKCIVDWTSNIKSMHLEGKTVTLETSTAKGAEVLYAAIDAVWGELGAEVTAGVKEVCDEGI